MQVTQSVNAGPFGATVTAYLHAGTWRTEVNAWITRDLRAMSPALLAEHARFFATAVERADTAVRALPVPEEA